MTKALFGEPFDFLFLSLVFSTDCFIFILKEKMLMKLNSAKLKVVLFDWDGTLAESSPPRILSVNSVLAEYGLPDWDSVKSLRNANLSFMDNFPNIFGNKAEEAYAKYCALYLEIIKKDFKGYPMACEVIKLLRSRGIKTAVMTNKDRRLFDVELPMLFPKEYFDRTVCGHEAPRDKPFGDHALYTLEGLLDFNEISPDTVWIVGDSRLDNLCAAAVHARPIRINHALQPEEKGECDNVIYFDDYNAFYQALD